MAALLPAPADALGAADLAGDPLARGTTIALPSIYRVDVTLRVPALRTARGRLLPVPGGGVLARHGTATAVAPDGVLVGAAHLLDPSPTTMARIGYQRRQQQRGIRVDDAQARRWVLEAGATAEGGRVLAIRVRQAEPDPGLGSPRRWTGRVIRTASYADLSLMRIDAPGAPALGLSDILTLGTPVVAIGFGREEGSAAAGDGNRPTIRRGRLDRTGLLDDPHRAATVVRAPIRRGDSGGPVIDGDGSVRGIIVLRGEHDGEGIIEQVGAVRRLLGDAEIAAGEGRSGLLWRRGLGRMWDLRIDEAIADLTALRRAFPAHPLAHGQALTATALAEADYHLEGRRRGRDLAAAIAAIALVLAGLCGLRLLWLAGARAGTPDA